MSLSPPQPLEVNLVLRNGLLQCTKSHNRTRIYISKSSITYFIFISPEFFSSNWLLGHATAPLLGTFPELVSLPRRLPKLSQTKIPNAADRVL